MEIQAHGALVDVLDVGVLLLGPSGVGKSECALELIRRGHVLVADDVVRIRSAERAGPEGVGPILLGSAPELIRHYMEIRGLGLLYIPDLYGASAVADQTEIHLICRLEHWREEADYERIGLSRPRQVLAGVDLPSLVLPVHPARNIATLVEAAVRDHLQRAKGMNAAERLDGRLRGEGRKRAASGDRGGRPDSDEGEGR